MPRLDMTLQELKERALFVRRDIIALLARSQTGHSGGPLSSADFGTVLFFHEMNVNPGRLDDPSRDMWHFSIGHVTPVIYSLMGERGYFPLVDLLQFRQFLGAEQDHDNNQDQHKLTPAYIEHSSSSSPGRLSNFRRTAVLGGPLPFDGAIIVSTVTIVQAAVVPTAVVIQTPVISHSGWA